MTDYLEIIDSYRDDLIKSLAESVSYRSVADSPAAGADGTVYPFGSEIEAAYQYLLNLGREFGFDIMDANHYGGHIEWKSEDPDAETLGIAAHADVVPEGDGWTRPAFGGVIEDGYMYGRGVQDDKGPLLMCLYAMKALKEAGFKPKRNIRLIIGLDEESGSVGLASYLEAAGMPDLGFTPDGDFPIINGEFGIMVFDLVMRIKPDINRQGLTLRKLEGGLAPNIVAGSARAVLVSESKALYDDVRTRISDYRKATGYNVTAKKAGNSMVVEATGVPTHGARPEHGLNAISILMDVLGRINLTGNNAGELIDFYNDYIGFNLHGEKIGCELSDKISGKLIFNVGMAEVNKDVASVTVNVRYPVTCTADQVYEGIEKTLRGTDIGILKKVTEEPIYIDPNDELVTELLQAYIDETGDIDGKPQVDRGGTYAKHFRRMVAFGALLPGDEDRMHQADERISIDSLMTGARIYARAIHRLCI